MDIGLHMRIGSNTTHSEPGAPTVTLSINGLTDNALHGMAAEHAKPLNLTATPDVAIDTYQWKTLQSGEISGANAAEFTPDANVLDGEALYCQVTLASGDVVVSPSYTVRHTPPTLMEQPEDLIFDTGTGDQFVSITGVFDGEALVYTATGGPVSIDHSNDQLVVETDVVEPHNLVTLRAENSGGLSETTFAIIIEANEEEGATYYLDPFTPEGLGTIAVSGSSIISGDPAGHWQIINQMLSPSAAGDLADLNQGPYQLELDDGSQIVLAITHPISDTSWALSSPKEDGFDIVIFDAPTGIEALEVSVNNGPFQDLGGTTPGIYHIGGLEPETAYRVAIRAFDGAGGPAITKSTHTIPADPRGFRGWNADIDLGTGGDFFVAPYGDDSNDGLSITSPLRTISAAVALATSGDVIKIRAGLYREMVEPGEGIALEGYGTEKPEITAAEPLTGFSQCGPEDVDKLGPFLGVAGSPIYKTLLPKSQVEHGQALALNIFDGDRRMFPATDRAILTDLFNDLNPNNFHTADSFNKDLNNKIISITDADVINSANYTEAQLLSCEVLLSHFPSVVSRLKITNVDFATHTIEIDGLRSPQVNGSAVDKYALTNVGPSLSSGTFYIEDLGTDLAVYVYPYDASQLDLIEFSPRIHAIKLGVGINAVRLRGLHVSRASGWSVTGGINIYKGDVQEKTTGHVMEHILSTGTFNSTTKARSIRLNFTDSCRIEFATFYDLMNGTGIVLNGGILSKDSNQVIIERNPGTMNLISCCLFQKIGATPLIVYHQNSLVMAHLYFEEVSTAAHSNKTNAYEQCHNVMWWGVEFHKNVQSFLTWQEASAVTVAWSYIPVFWPYMNDRRAIVDQTSITPPEVLNSNGYIFNNHVPTQYGTPKGGTAVLLTSSYSDVSMTILNNVLDSITSPGRANPPYDQFASNLITYLGYDGGNQTPQDFPAGNQIELDLDVVYEDPANGNFDPAPGSPILTLVGQDTSQIIADLQATYPQFTRFDRDYKNQLIDTNLLPIGPDAGLNFERMPVLRMPQGSVTGATTATGGVTADFGGGTLYAGLWDSATPPDAAAIMAGTGALFHTSVTDVTIGSHGFSATDLPENSTLTWHFLHDTVFGVAQLEGPELAFGSAAVTGTNLMPDPGFDDPTKWSGFAGYNVVNSMLEISAAAENFTTIGTHFNHRVPVVGGRTYEIAVDVVSAAVTERLRILANELENGASLGMTIGFDTLSSGPALPGTRLSFQITTQSTTNELSISFNKIDSFEAMLDNISCIEVSG